MAESMCTECNCPRTWHNVALDGHCYGCGKTCETLKVKPIPPFEIAQDMKEVQ